VELRDKPAVQDTDRGFTVKRHRIPASTRSFLAAVSAVWADVDNASRRLVEHQMGPKGRRHS
jgi:hypothetical protein